MKKIIGIDIGGTKICCAIATPRGKILKKAILPTEVKKGADYTLGRVIETVHNLLKGAKVSLREIKAIGIGAPGPLDPVKGVILNTPNMPTWRGVNLKKILGREFRHPVVLDNDANAAALGEKMFGAGKKVKDLFYFTVSTGIGGGLILDGKIRQGASFDAAEVGHITILPGGPRCGCGKRGCLEALSSGTAIARRARERVKNNRRSKILKLANRNPRLITAKLVAQAAREGDKLAQEIYREAGYYLGIGVSNVLNLINPEMVVIGGGASRAGGFFFRTVRRSAKKAAFGRTYGVAKIVPAKLGDSTGVLGAVSLTL